MIVQKHEFETTVTSIKNVCDFFMFTGALCVYIKHGECYTILIVSAIQLII